VTSSGLSGLGHAMHYSPLIQHSLQTSDSNTFSNIIKLVSATRKKSVTWI